MMNSLNFIAVLPIANLMTEPVGVAHYMIVGAVLFTCGLLCMATKRNALGVLMGIELILNGANLNFIAYGSPYLRNDANALGLEGQLMAIFVIVLAAAEAAVVLAIVLNFYNNHNSIDVDRANQLQG
jgi:NAD(P)H-quinone oxidoreductase subunit 4L